MAKYKPIDMMSPYRAKSISRRLTSAQGQRKRVLVAFVLGEVGVGLQGLLWDREDGSVAVQRVRLEGLEANLVLSMPSFPHEFHPSFVIDIFQRRQARRGRHVKGEWFAVADQFEKVLSAFVHPDACFRDHEIDIREAEEYDIGVAELTVKDAAGVIGVFLHACACGSDIG